MKKFLAIAAAIVMAAGVMSGCSSSTTEETPVEGEETTEEGAEGEETAERTQFIVGFDAEYPTDIWTKTESMSDLTLTLLRKSATGTDGSL